MRPGQTAPECLGPSTSEAMAAPRFNEAGADCPGMQLRRTVRVTMHSTASMRPGQTAPECLAVRVPVENMVSTLQ